MNSPIRVKRYKPTQLAELSDCEIARMLRRGQDPARGLTPYQVAWIVNGAIEKLRRRPALLMVLARAIAARRELIDAERMAGWVPFSEESRPCSHPASFSLY